METNILCGHSALYLETFPTSGMWDAGGLYPLPLSGHLTGGTGFSSSPGLLGTPRSAHGMGDTLDSVKARGGRDRGTLEQDLALLPTATASDWKGPVRHPGQEPGRWDRGTDLPEAISLLPTPNAGNFNDGEDPETWEARRQANLAKEVNGNGQGTPLSMAVQMLPTPNARDWKGPPGEGARERGGHQASLPASISMLPTPTARDGKGSSQTQGRVRPHRVRGPGDMDLTEAMRLIGDDTSPLSPGGRLCSDGPLPGQLKLPLGEVDSG
jgi:hypothetical protein